MPHIVAERLRRCRTCNATTLHQRNEFRMPFLANGFLTVFTCGLWFIVVIIMESIKAFTRWSCSECRANRPLLGGIPIISPLWRNRIWQKTIMALLALLFLIVVYDYFQNYPAKGPEKTQTLSSSVLSHSPETSVPVTVATDSQAATETPLASVTATPDNSLKKENLAETAIPTCDDPAVRKRMSMTFIQMGDEAIGPVPEFTVINDIPDHGHRICNVSLSLAGMQRMMPDQNLPLMPFYFVVEGTQGQPQVKLGGNVYFDPAEIKSIIASEQKREQTNEESVSEPQPISAPTENIPAPESTSALSPASFDCGLARSILEVLICGDASLADLDGQVATAYNTKRDKTVDDAQRNALLENQRQFLRSRTENCQVPYKANITEEESQSLVMCLKSLYRKRLIDLHQ